MVWPSGARSASGTKEASRSNYTCQSNSLPLAMGKVAPFARPLPVSSCSELNEFGNYALPHNNEKQGVLRLGWGGDETKRAVGGGKQVGMEPDTLKQIALEIHYFQLLSWAHPFSTECTNENQRRWRKDSSRSLCEDYSGSGAMNFN